MPVDNDLRCTFAVTIEPFYKTVNAHADIETAESHIGIYLAVIIYAGIDHGAHGTDYPKEGFLMEFKPQVYEAEYEPHCLDCGNGDPSVTPAVASGQDGHEGTRNPCGCDVAVT